MQSIVFELNSEYIELCNLLKVVGIADSGGQGKMMVADGLIKVDGQLELRKTAKIRASQQVEFGDQAIQITQSELRQATKTKPKTQKLANSSPFHLKTSKHASPKHQPSKQKTNRKR